MSRFQQILAIAAGLFSLWALIAQLPAPDTFGMIFAAAGVLTLVRFVRPLPVAVDLGLAVLGTVLLLMVAPPAGTPNATGAAYWPMLAATWLFAWLFVERFSGHVLSYTALGAIIPVIVGVSLLLIWELVVRGLGVPQIVLPPPSSIGARIVASWQTLMADFVQTFVKAVLIGYVIGCAVGLLTAIAVDRSPFLKRGLLPIGNFVSALPLVGIAPIMVMWFGFDWHSKAAVVAIMTFFPMLVNTIAGLNAAGHLERDMMRTYASSYWQTLFKLRLPAAAPFIFNALKINSTLALIGAIVAEFFGTPIVGMGFRISTEVGRFNVDMVWAEIAVAAVAGTAFYGVIVLIERAVTFWHPSVRGGRA